MNGWVSFHSEIGMRLVAGLAKPASQPMLMMMIVGETSWIYVLWVPVGRWFYIVCCELAESVLLSLSCDYKQNNGQAANVGECTHDGPYYFETMEIKMPSRCHFYLTLLDIFIYTKECQKVWGKAENNYNKVGTPLSHNWRRATVWFIGLICSLEAINW